MTPDPIEEMLGAYALDALTPEERALVDAYLPSSPASQEEVSQLSEVAGRLATSAIPRDPPPALRARLLDIVEREAAEWRDAREAEGAPRQLHANAPTAVDAGPSSIQERQPPPMALVTGPRSASPSPVAPGPGTGWGPRVRDSLARFPAYAYGAVGSVVVAAVILVIVLVNRNGVPVTQRTGGPVAQVVDGVRLTGVHFTVDIRGDHTTRVQFQGLPTLPAGKAFELWLVPAHGKPVPVGGFVGNSSHDFSKTYSVDAKPYAVAAVTIERAPGNAATPTLPLALAAKLT
ncbi:MAG TPA: anti-sigma factor [Chloroflexota bacterium]|nr:anti-sigma factor [Chloroflexota bacterium]